SLSIASGSAPSRDGAIGSLASSAATFFSAQSSAAVFAFGCASRASADVSVGDEATTGSGVEEEHAARASPRMLATEASFMGGLPSRSAGPRASLISAPEGPRAVVTLCGRQRIADGTTRPHLTFLSLVGLLALLACD